ncbi:MAG TPA: hypothetical protein VIY68_20710 [Steroidobacteraceae bacterium]
MQLALAKVQQQILRNYLKTTEYLDFLLPFYATARLSKQKL